MSLAVDINLRDKSKPRDTNLDQGTYGDQDQRALTPVRRTGHDNNPSVEDIFSNQKNNHPRGYRSIMI